MSCKDNQKNEKQLIGSKSIGIVDIDRNTNTTEKKDEIKLQESIECEARVKNNTISIIKEKQGYYIIYQRNTLLILLEDELTIEFINFVNGYFQSTNAFYTFKYTGNNTFTGPLGKITKIFDDSYMAYFPYFDEMISRSSPLIYMGDIATGYSDEFIKYSYDYQKQFTGKYTFDSYEYFGENEKDILSQVNDRKNDFFTVNVNNDGFLWILEKGYAFEGLIFKIINDKTFVHGNMPAAGRRSFESYFENGIYISEFSIENDKWESDIELRLYYKKTE
jgi:hypothetical protein